MTTTTQRLLGCVRWVPERQLDPAAWVAENASGDMLADFYDVGRTDLVGAEKALRGELREVGMVVDSVTHGTDLITAYGHQVGGPLVEVARADCDPGGCWWYQLVKDGLADGVEVDLTIGDPDDIAQLLIRSLAADHDVEVLDTEIADDGTTILAYGRAPQSVKGRLVAQQLRELADQLECARDADLYRLLVWVEAPDAYSSETEPQTIAAVDRLANLVGMTPTKEMLSGIWQYGAKQRGDLITLDVSATVPKPSGRCSCGGAS